MNTNFTLLLFIFIVFNYQQVSTRGGRGGGSRSGGSRSGGSRTGSRSSSSARIGLSSRYSTWSSRHGLSSSFRYRTTSYYDVKHGISTGLILTSYNHRTTYILSNEQQYNDISICYNELPLYERNITASPWFVCPWEDDPRYKYCCGSEIEERCCTFFEGPGFVAMMIVGSISVLVFLVIYYFYKRPKKKTSSENINIDNVYSENPNMVQLPPVITTNVEHIDVTSNQIANSDEKCPLYPFQNDTGPMYPNSIETLPVENVPTASFNASNESNLPYPTNPIISIPESHCSQFNSLSYEDTGLPYPLIPPEHPPPSYSDVIKENKF